MKAVLQLLVAAAIHIHIVYSTQSSNGTATTTFVSMEVLETITYSFYGEGIAYDQKRDRLLLGSLKFGTLISVPRSTIPSKNIQYAEEDVIKVISERPASFNGSNFLGLEMDPIYDDIVWGAISYGPNPTYGIARVNITDGFVSFFDLSHLVANISNTSVQF